MINFKITDEENFSPSGEIRSDKLVEDILICRRLLDNPKIKHVKTIERFIKEYPKEPQFHNFKIGVYSLLGKQDKALALNRKLIEKFPNYLFAKLNLAFEYLQSGELEKVPEILGETLVLGDLYPERKVFHLSEVSNYIQMVGRYYFAVKNLEKLEECKKVMEEEVDRTSTVIEDLSDKILLLKMSLLMTNAKKRKDYNIEIDENCLIGSLYPQTDEKPKLIHKELEKLFFEDEEFYLDEVTINEILALPHHSLIEDLKVLLKDTLYRYEYNTDEGYGLYALHILILLYEIGDDSVLEDILEFFKIERDVTDYYFGDVLTCSFWLIFYKLGFNKFEQLKDFMLLPAINTFHKTEISKAVCQIALHHPERYDSCVLWFKEILSYYRDASLDDNVIDSSLIGLMVGDVIDMKAVELLPLIKELFDKEIIDETINGDYEETKDLFNSKNREKLELLDAKGIYDDIRSWSSKKPISEAEPTPEYHTPIIKDDKIGRNDPCICGSGKKYKKCCGR